MTLERAAELVAQLRLVDHNAAIDLFWRDENGPGKDSTGVSIGWLPMDGTHLQRW